MVTHTLFQSFKKNKNYDKGIMYIFQINKLYNITSNIIIPSHWNFSTWINHKTKLHPTAQTKNKNATVFNKQIITEPTQNTNGHQQLKVNNCSRFYKI